MERAPGGGTAGRSRLVPPPWRYFAGAGFCASRNSSTVMYSGEPSGRVAPASSSSTRVFGPTATENFAGRLRDLRGDPRHEGRQLGRLGLARRIVPRLGERDVGAEARVVVVRLLEPEPVELVLGGDHRIGPGLRRAVLLHGHDLLVAAHPHDLGGHLPGGRRHDQRVRADPVQVLGLPVAADVDDRDVQVLGPGQLEVRELRLGLGAQPRPLRAERRLPERDGREQVALLHGLLRRGARGRGGPVESVWACAGKAISAAASAARVRTDGMRRRSILGGSRTASKGARASRPQGRVRRGPDAREGQRADGGRRHPRHRARQSGAVFAPAIPRRVGGK